MRLQETIRRILKEETRFQKMGEEKYKSCFISDITRMEIIDNFFNQVNEILISILKNLTMICY